ncbi:Lrp/AsnC family transcriptional regulator [Paenibacillus sp. FSL R7-0048]|uniref:AsnC family transcriptional regulator n=1 Tax=Paenibacillus odorifer TaxID=189426 RepID=A0ABX3GK25_9BACL|nr:MULTISPECIES: Lrp/AsnC family transcriptional regulator [Paenibacillus]MDH6430728.1 Lrp/AsnC family leucine-responsive transcriptional regulator [Paenibacillus sp. PastH-4]MDH6446577.1 Lrp/AsnC family leucine-responsive transcriptional regulator [Paenibacillus sp. PastF-4]MDH6530965.1 Lrp/AsnC family leucine-responsive transcriptional regulator [Paenibacillus sp. PastH-3]OMC63567.1 AsnC family transcriptional regulator [Paenibacillus odorifer]OMD28147.1 AsnC family transcriptional regulator
MDHVDKQILFYLQNQARISMTELGKSVGLSQPAVTERVRRMEEKGIIEEYRTIISPEKIGKNTAAYMLFRTRDCLAFLDFVHASPQVAECHRISGEHSYLLKVVTESTHALEEFGNQCDKYGTYTILIVMSSPIDHRFLIHSLEEASKVD